MLGCCEATDRHCTSRRYAPRHDPRRLSHRPDRSRVAAAGGPAPHPSARPARGGRGRDPRTPPVKPGGRPATYPRREVVNGIRYVLRSGCAWRMLPHDLPPWQLVYHYFWVWRREGVWQAIHDALRPQARQAQGRRASPSAAILDSQSVKTTEKGGPGGTTRARR